MRIRETHDDAGVIGLHGVVRSVSGSLCSVFVRDEDKTVSGVNLCVDGFGVSFVRSLVSELDFFGMFLS